MVTFLWEAWALSLSVGRACISGTRSHGGKSLSHGVLARVSTCSPHSQIKSVFPFYFFNTHLKYKF